MEHLVRDCYKGGGYVFATDALETAKASGWEDIALLAAMKIRNHPHSRLSAWQKRP
jgi:hypothetical protein